MGPFSCLTKLGAQRADTSAKVRATKSRRNFLQGTHPIHSVRPYTDVLVCFVLFGCIWDSWLPYGTRCKTGRTSAKVRATKSRWNFSQRKHPIHPLNPKLTFWCVSNYLGAFGTVWLPYETRSKTGRISAKIRATKSRRNFSQRTHPIHPIGL